MKKARESRRRAAADAATTDVDGSALRERRGSGTTGFEDNAATESFRC